MVDVADVVDVVAAASVSTGSAVWASRAARAAACSASAAALAAASAAALAAASAAALAAASRCPKRKLGKKKLGKRREREETEYLALEFGLALLLALALLLDELELLFDHGLEGLVVDGLAAGALQLLLEQRRRLDEAALLRLELVLDLLQLRLQLLLVHRQRVHLPLEHLRVRRSWRRQYRTRTSKVRAVEQTQSTANGERSINTRSG